MNNRVVIAVSAVVFSVLVLLIPALDILAKNVRAVPVTVQQPRVMFVNDVRQLWNTWESANLHGRIILHLGRHLHYEPVPENRLYSLDQGPISRLKLSEAYHNNLSHRNYLWVSARRGMFRSIHYVLSEPDLRRRASEAGVANGETFSVSQSGFPRTFSLQPPRGSMEVPVLHVDLSWLEQHDPDEVIGLLKRLPVKPDIITVSAATDDPDRAAVAAERFARLKELLPHDRL